MAAPLTSLTFKIYKGEELLGEETLQQAVIKVGKLSSSHLRLEDESVSRMHAVIEVSSSSVSIIDLGSTTGTIVNGKNITKEKLHSGDTIVLGSIRLELTIAAGVEEDEEEEPTQIARAPLAAPLSPPLAAPAPLSAPVAASAGFSAPAAAAPLVATAPVAVAAAPDNLPLGAPPAFGADSINDMGGARSIEVATLLGDSVIGVKHVMNPRGGKVTAVTYALFAAGIAMLLASSVSMISGVITVSDNKARLHKFMNPPEGTPRRAAHKFRPRRLPQSYDFMAIGGLIGGILCMTAGLVRFRKERIIPTYRIGTAPGVDFETEATPVADFALVAPLGDDFVFNYATNWQGEMVVDGNATQLADLLSKGQARQSSAIPGALEVSIPHKTRITVTAGNQTYMVSSVPKPVRQPVPFRIDGPFMGYVAAAAIVIFGFVKIVLSVSPQQASLYADAFDNSDRLSHLQNKPQEEAIIEEEETDGDEEESGGTGTAMAEAEGKMGKEESTRATGQYAMEKKDNVDPQLAREKARDEARTAGALGAFAQAPGGAFASLTATGDFSSGLDDADVYGGLLGNEVGEMAGGAGFGVEGVGPGGGGTGMGTIGRGRLGTLGHGDGTGNGYSSGGGNGGMRSRKARPPEVKFGNITSNGELDANIIRRYIRRKLPRISHCYERELVVNAKLRGTVVSSFQISPTGSVQGATVKGLGNSNVESCVAGALKSIQFPKPKGGGYVNVRYPFTFSPAG